MNGKSLKLGMGLATVALTWWLGALAAGCAGGTSDPSDPPQSLNSGDPLSKKAQAGERLFGSMGCSSCHTVNGKGGDVGPDLTNEGNSGRSKQWLAQQIRDPKKHDPATVMPGFGNRLSKEQINELVAYLESLKAKAS